MTLSQILFFYFQILFLISTDTGAEHIDLIKNDFNKCMETEPTSCKSTILSDNSLRCCITNTIYDEIPSIISNTSISSCSVYTAIKITEDQINQIEKVYREAIGFIFSFIGRQISNYALNFKQEFDCPSQSFTINYEIGSYTREELDIFQSENYCLRLYYQGLIDLEYINEINFETLLHLERKEINQNDCYDAILLPSSEDFSTCAFASFYFVLENGHKKQVNTCLYISNNAFDTKTLDEHLRSSFSSYESLDGYNIQSYKIKITDKNNNKLSYDSTTKQLTYPSETEGENKY